MSGRVLIACVGNVLAGDDGFGVAVAQRLAEGPALPAGIEVIETGIGGMSIVQQLMEGYDALIVVDAVERDVAPGSVFVLEPSVERPSDMPLEEWRGLFSNLHLAEPGRVFLLAKAVGALPFHVRVVGCQPLTCDDLVAQLSLPVQAAVDVAVATVREQAYAALAASELAPVAV